MAMNEVRAWPPMIRRVWLQRRTGRARLLISAGMDSPDVLHEVTDWLHEHGFPVVTIEMVADLDMVRVVTHGGTIQG